MGLGWGGRAEASWGHGSCWGSSRQAGLAQTPTVDLGFAEGAWAVASHPGRPPVHPEEEASSVCAHHLSCTRRGG